MEFVGPNSGDFAIQSSTCPPVMTPGLVCFLNLTFTPTGLGLRTARLKIFDNASNRPQVFHLSGYGVRGRLPRSPTGLVFGAVAKGSSKALSIRLTNPETVALEYHFDCYQGAQCARIRRDRQLRRHPRGRQLLHDHSDLHTDRGGPPVWQGENFRRRPWKLAGRLSARQGDKVGGC